MSAQVSQVFLLNLSGFFCITSPLLLLPLSPDCCSVACLSKGATFGEVSHGAERTAYSPNAGFLHDPRKGLLYSTFSWFFGEILNILFYGYNLLYILVEVLWWRHHWSYCSWLSSQNICWRFPVLISVKSQIPSFFLMKDLKSWAPTASESTRVAFSLPESETLKVIDNPSDLESNVTFCSRTGESHTPR